MSLETQRCGPTGGCGGGDVAAAADPRARALSASQGHEGRRSRRPSAPSAPTSPPPYQSSPDSPPPPTHDRPRPSRSRRRATASARTLTSSRCARVSRCGHVDVAPPRWTRGAGVPNATARVRHERTPPIQRHRPRTVPEIGVMRARDRTTHCADPPPHDQPRPTTTDHNRPTTGRVEPDQGRPQERLRSHRGRAGQVR